MTDFLDIFKAAFVSIYPELGDEEWDYLKGHCHQFTAPTKSIIIEENKVQQHLFFLTSGLVRGYYIDEQGQEISIRFVNEKGWVTHYTALILNAPSKYIYQALEESEVIALPYAVVKEGYTKFKGLEKFGRLIAESVLKTQQKRIESFQFLSAEERYLAFIADHPAVFSRVSVSHLCTYLGIQRQSLTRIRKKLASQ